MKFQSIVMAAVFGMAAATHAAAEGPEDLKDVCDSTIPADAKTARLLNASAMLVQTSHLHINPDFTYRIESENLGTSWCPGTIFRDREHLLAGRSAMLIGPDTIATAAHAVDVDPTGWYVVFRSLNERRCSNLNTTHIAAEDIYAVDGRPAPINTYGLTSPAAAYDYLVFKLQRPVVDRQPVKIRRSGAPLPGQLIRAASHPLMAGLKLDVDARYAGPEVPAPGLEPNPLFSNLHSFGGSSGGGIYNVEDDTLEALFQQGPQNGAWDPVGACIRFPLPTIRSIGGAFQPIAALIPREELGVTPLGRVVHKASIGKALQQPTTTYTISGYEPAPGAEVALQPQPLAIEHYNEVEISPPYIGVFEPGTPPPTLTTDLSGSVSVLTNGSETMTLTADSSNVANCGAWDFQVDVHDVANDYQFPIRHRFEVGLREAEVLPNDDWPLNGFELPLAQSKTYTVRNTRPDPVSLVVAPDQLWLLVNGQHSVAITLGVAGSPTDSATVTVTLNPLNAHKLEPDMAHSANIEFIYDDQDCLASESPMTRGVTLNYGRRSFDFTTLVTLTPATSPSPWGPPATISLPMEFPGLCITDLNLHFAYIKDSDAGSGIAGTEASFGRPGDLKLIWQGGTIPTGYLGIGKYWVADETLQLPALRFDDTVTPPTAGTLLAHFVGMELTDTFEVAFRADAAFDNSAVTPAAVRMDITAVSCSLP